MCKQVQGSVDSMNTEGTSKGPRHKASRSSSYSELDQETADSPSCGQHPQAPFSRELCSCSFLCERLSPCPVNSAKLRQASTGQKARFNATSSIVVSFVLTIACLRHDLAEAICTSDKRRARWLLTMIAHEDPATSCAYLYLSRAEPLIEAEEGTLAYTERHMYCRQCKGSHEL